MATWTVRQRPDFNLAAAWYQSDSCLIGLCWLPDYPAAPWSIRQHPNLNLTVSLKNWNKKLDRKKRKRKIIIGPTPQKKEFLDSSKKNKFWNEKKIPPPSPQKKCWTTSKPKIRRKKKWFPNYFFSIHGNGDTICIGWEIQYLPCARFFRTWSIIVSSSTAWWVNPTFPKIFLKKVWECRETFSAWTKAKQEKKKKRKQFWLVFC